MMRDTLFIIQNFKYNLSKTGQPGNNEYDFLFQLDLGQKYWMMLNIIQQQLKMLQGQRAPKPRGPEFQARPQIKNLTNTAKSLYAFFNTFQLEMSRLTKYPQFQDMVEEITLFNDELDKWKKNTHDIKNVIVTYHLYENLFSRLRYISNFSRNQEDAFQAVAQASRWFKTQKPKLRCQVKEVKGTMKTCSPDKRQSNNIESMVQTAALKRQMQPYEMMSRTAHPGFFPPKEQLKQYKRKQFLPFGGLGEQETEPQTIKKSASASILHRSKLSKYRTSVGTMMATTASSGFKQTKDGFQSVTEFKPEEQKVEQKQDQLSEKKEGQEGEAQAEEKKEQGVGEEVLDDLQRGKKVEQDEAMQENLVQQVNQEDEPDEEVIYEEEAQKKQTHLYIRDHNKFDMQIAEEQSKEAQQSTLRRVMKINEDKIRSQMEELDLKRNMMNWGKVRGKTNRQQARKLQTLMHFNKYKNLAYEKKLMEEADNPEGEKKFFATTGFKDFKSKKEPVVVPMLYRSKSSNPVSMESDLQKLKLKQTMRTYGKYISNHVAQPDATPIQIKSSKQQTSTEDFRSTSLTSFAKKGKSSNKNNLGKGFSSVVAQQNPKVYNEAAENDLLRIKTSLSGKSMPIEKGTIYRAMSVVPIQETVISNGMYTSGRDLLSNPFFPKHLYGSKKKKKKAKK